MTPVEMQTFTFRRGEATFHSRGRAATCPILLLLVLRSSLHAGIVGILQFNNLMIVARQAVVLLVAALGMTFVIIAGLNRPVGGAIVALSALVAAHPTGSLGYSPSRRPVSRVSPLVNSSWSPRARCRPSSSRWEQS